MDNSITVIGEITSAGKLLTYGQNFIDDFCKKNPNKRAEVCIKVYEKGSTASLIGYYRNKILPDIQKAYYLTGVIKSLEVIDNELRSATPLTVNEKFNSKTNKYEIDIVPLEDLESWKLTAFIDIFIYRFAAENLHVYIDKTVTL